MKPGPAVPIFACFLLSLWNSGTYAAEQASELFSKRQAETGQILSVEAGESHYVMCLGCHSPGYNRTGPMHCFIFGRPAGSQEGYQYSEALKASKLRWDRQTLDTFLEAPVKVVPGTSMTFVGIADARVRKQLIDYLASLTPNHTDCH